MFPCTCWSWNNPFLAAIVCSSNNFSPVVSRITRPSTSINMQIYSSSELHRVNQDLTPPLRSVRKLYFPDSACGCRSKQTARVFETGERCGGPLCRVTCRVTWCRWPDFPDKTGATTDSQRSKCKQKQFLNSQHTTFVRSEINFYPSRNFLRTISSILRPSLRLGISPRMISAFSSVKPSGLRHRRCPSDGHCSHAWPISACGLRLNDEVLRVAIGIRLGIGLCETHDCPCGSTVDRRVVMSAWSWPDTEAQRNQRHYLPNAPEGPNPLTEGTKGIIRIYYIRDGSDTVSV